MYRYKNSDKPFWIACILTIMIGIALITSSSLASNSIDQNLQEVIHEIIFKK